MYYLTYDLSIWSEESVCEEFNTVDELLERYEDIQYEVSEIEAWENDKKIFPYH